MVDWPRSRLLLLSLYCLFQLCLYWFVIPASVTVASGTPAGTGAGRIEECAANRFQSETATERVTQYDTTPYLVPPYARAVNNGEAVFEHLSLLRESTRDGWIHFAGDAALKQTYYEYNSILSRNGVFAPLSEKVEKKRLASRHAKDDARIGSARTSFRYAPMYADLTRDWEKLWKETNPPSLVVLSAGSVDAISRVSVDVGVLEAEQDALIEAIRSKLAPRVAAGQKIPVVLFLAPSTFVDHAATTITAEQKTAIERVQTLTEQMRMKLRLASATFQSIGTTNDIPVSSGFGPLGFADTRSLALPIRGVVPQFSDEGVRVFLNPAILAVSLAAFTTCALPTPQWEVRAFTPGQIALAMLWTTVLFLWAYTYLKRHWSWFGSSFTTAAYHRVNVADAGEIELGQTGSDAATGSVDSGIIHGHRVGDSSFLDYLSSPSCMSVLASLVQLGCVLLFMFLMDGNQRLSWSIIGDKQYIRDTFLFLLVVIGVFAFRSMSPTTDNTDALLNREQTEEWKGWMQILFVLYHFFAAKEMYNMIRVFIAAYVWMTGYGNFFFFYKTNDYSFARLMKLLFRLNFFVAFTCIALNREFMQYYVCALHTFYFFCVYLTMGIMWQWNKNDRLLLLKFVGLFLFLFLLFDVPDLGLFNLLFQPFSIFYWNHSIWEWWFRSKLDHYATLFGMICAWNVKRIEDFLAKMENNTNTKQKYLVQATTAVILIGFGLIWMVYCLWQPKVEYNAQHPYTSLIPILLYILLRNLTPWLRRHVLHLFTWFGKITLETYILQFHIWLSDDAATIITYLPNYPMINFVLTTAIYVALSVLIFHVTNILSDCLIPRGCTVPDLLLKMCVIIGGWFTIQNIIQFTMAATI